MRVTGVLTLLGAASLASAQSSSVNTSLPVVDLGYQLQRASGFNSTGAYYNFSNIRYAAPPVGNLRWAHPQRPEVNRSVIQDGQDARICPQAASNWEDIAEQFVPQYLLGQRTFNLSSYTYPNVSVPAPSPGETEDCLFLDVFVPEEIWNNRNSSQKAPVLFWIYGGGFVFGSKVSSGSPSGLLYRAQNNSQPGVIYVAPNYRLGAFGWMGGPSFQAQGGLANAGLYDQRRALKWVQKNIHKFGGDKDQVTVFGESAGGSSIMHQITAFGGLKGKNDFKRAVLQSPANLVIPSLNAQEIIFQNYLNATNATSLAQLRSLDYQTLQNASVITTETATYGTFTYGPMVDGVIIPSIPGQMLARGSFDHSPTLMIGQNADEGLEFTNPAAQNATEEELAESLYASIPTLRGLPDQTDYILNTLYPPIFNDSAKYGYSDGVGRASIITSNFAFICNTFYLDKAFKNQTYSYLFNVFPALHGFDVPYTYSTANNSAAPPVAIELQDYITQFAEFGTPNAMDGVPYFFQSGANASVLELNASTVGDVMSPAANERCNYWQSGLWY